MGIRNFPERCSGGWKLGLGDAHAPLHFITDREMGERRVQEEAGLLKIVWQGHPQLGPGFRVEAEWRREGELFAAGFGYSGFSGGEFVEEIHFPILEMEYGENAQFVSGAFDMGCIYGGESRFRAGSKNRIRYASMQFSALCDSGRGIYIDHRDPEWHFKAEEIEISADGRRLTCSSVHFMELGEHPRESFRLPYESCAGEFSGGWFEAARLYRPWALRQPWVRNRTGENPLRKIGLWVWNRGPAGEVAPPVEQLQAECREIPVALDWYWWHSNPYDTDYPDFWPPREGEECFRNAVRRLTKQGIHTQVYVNGVCWDLDGGSWAEGGAESVVVRRGGEPYAHAFNKYNGHRLGFMCGEAPAFHDRLSALLKKLRESGLSGQYLDMIGNATYNCCYNPAHKHGRGGGGASGKGYRTLLRRLKRENPDYPLTVECAHEAYMDLADGAIVCNSVSAEHLGTGDREPIPLFTAVYHGAFALFGNYATPDGTTPWDPLWPPEDRWKNEKPWHRLYPDQFFVEMIRPVIWGVQPMVCNLKPSIRRDPEFHEAYRFILDTAKFYHENRKFLFDGEMLPPDGFECGSKEVEFMCRMIFTREDECRIQTKRLPCVLHSCWKAPDGESALFLGNYTGREQAWKYKDRKGSIPAHSFRKLPL
ncbi:MAG: hypothetical protein HPZ91_10315 [Lentisphaeria bacterium]|nr:hypothetical protein [Lentisphaeria bacterium]